MNKYSYIALLVAVIAGIFLGSLFQQDRSGKELSKTQEEYRIKIEEQIKFRENTVKILSQEILNGEAKLLESNERIDSLNNSLKTSKRHIAKLKEQAVKLTATQKEKWIEDRYAYAPEQPDSVHLSDTVSALLITDLIEKDGLVEEVKIQGLTIGMLERKDSINQGIITLHEQKDVQQDSIISDQKEITSSLKDENKDLKREIRKHKIKEVGLKIVVIAEAVVIVLLAL